LGVANGIKDANELTKDGEMILNYFGTPNVTTKVVIQGESELVILLSAPVILQGGGLQKGGGLPLALVDRDMMFL
jgi:hypothetical protein